MCTPNCYIFAEAALTHADVRGRRVLEVGARDFNGSVRKLIMSLEPASYIAVDMLPGPGVDVVCNAEDLVQHFGPASFDIVISTEMLEHVRDWRRVVSNLKTILPAGGVLVLTTRSKGFPFHGYPGDFWRFDLDDFRLIFSDTHIESLESDTPSAPGVFLKARKPHDFTEMDLDRIQVYSIIRRRRTNRAGALDVTASTLTAFVWRTSKRFLPVAVLNKVRSRAWHNEPLPSPDLP